MKIPVFLLCFTAFVALGIHAWARDQEKDVESPSLSEVVFFGTQPAMALIRTDYPQAQGACIRRYLDAMAPGSILLKFEVPFDLEKVVALRKRNLAEQMVVILGKEVRSEAESFAREVPLLAEWEGMSDGPMAEADFAKDWMRRKPRTAISPFLHLYMAHRLRAAYEAAHARNEKAVLPVLAAQYREAMKEARLSANPLIICLADDLEAQPFVYLKGQGRP